MRVLCFVLAFAFLLAQTNVALGSKVIYCYWGTWSHYRPGDGQFQVNNIDPNLCTHLGYAFFGLGDNDEIKSLDPWLDYNLGNIAKTIDLKKNNTELKVLASIGGWSEGSTKYSAMASSSDRRAKFISSVLDFLQEHNFDGLDLDWEYPAQREGSPDDRVNFVTLLKELNTALKAHNLLLVAAVAAGPNSASISYDIPEFTKHLDFINIMTYDFSGPWEKTAGFNAPLKGSGINNVMSSVDYWIKNGAPRDKMLLGLPLYGHSFTLADSAKNEPGSPVTGGGTPGPFTRESGILGYTEICLNLKAGWTKRWDSAQCVPYAFNGNQWVGYDDVRSLELKIDYIKSLNLAGAMVWSIETDDFRGLCGKKNPLLKAVNKALNWKKWIKSLVPFIH